MSLGVQVLVTGGARASVERARVLLGGPAINPVIGQAASNVVRAHLFGLNESRANHLGGRRTNYFLGAGRGTSWSVTGDTVTVSIRQIGIRQKFYGGTIKPKNAQFLTIPVAPEAYGKRAREFGDLVLVFGDNGQPIALATKGTRAVQITQSKSGKIIKRQIGRTGVIMFRLVRSVTQLPDPTILPDEAEIFTAVKTAVDETVDRQLRRRL
ncbi:MAG: hypothetical protein WC661_21360 [Opitutaceae bacterium]|jgi:hypothetical protein